MPIIKLDAIDSTNDYLKQLARENEVENYTVVMAYEQTKGRGQMGAKWFSEPGKNLTMSVLIKDLQWNGQTIFDLNVAVALAIANVLKQLSIPGILIKWPNDIMADGKKLGGILIENSLKADGSFTAIVGIGLNVNQTNFEGLPQATSLRCVTDKIFELEELALQIGTALPKHLIDLNEKKDTVWQNYHDLLFKKEVPVVLEDKEGKRFMGIIQGVSREGKLVVLLEDDSVRQYEVKEIKLLY